MYFYVSKVSCELEFFGLIKVLVIPEDFEDWTPKKRWSKKGRSNDDS
jgi:hypothetical protein